MQSPYFTPEHDLFRQTVRQFIETEVAPHANEWEAARRIPRSIWQRMGELGFLGINFEEQYGGSDTDFFYSAIWVEEIARSLMGGFSAAVSVHQYMATAHLARAGSHELKQKYLAPAIAGEKVAALGISEAGGGSDVAALRTTARREGNEYVINGSKTFITNGVFCDFITLACRTRSADGGNDGISLIIVNREAAGFTANQLKKMGWHSSDTGELFFDNVRVPVSNLIGEEGMGFYYIMDSFQLERLIGGIGSLAGAFVGMEQTLRYINERQAFGRPIGKFQALRHELVNMATEMEAARQLSYYAAWLYDRGLPCVKECSMVKLLDTEVFKKAADVFLQFFGGYGYMEEYPIERLYRDARVGTIVGGTSQIMREILSKIIIDSVRSESGYGRKTSVQPPQAAVQSAKETTQPAIFHSQNTQPAMANLETAREIVLSLPDRLKKHKVADDYETVVNLDIEGERGGQFTVTVKDKECTVEEGFVGTPKCKVTTKDSTYEATELGRENAQMAVMMGKIKLTNIAEMLTFVTLFERLG